MPTSTRDRHCKRCRADVGIRPYDVNRYIHCTEVSPIQLYKNRLHTHEGSVQAFLILILDVDLKQYPVICTKLTSLSF